jgi:hypothetical protein
MMGLAVAQRNHYVVSDDCLQSLASFTAKVQHDNGSFHDSAFLTATQFAAMAFSFTDDLSGAKTPSLSKSVDYLLERQKSTGEVPIDHNEPPIDQGSIMTTANSAIAFQQAYRESGTDKYHEAAEKAVVWITEAKPETTQDEAFQILALARFGSPERRRVVNGIVERLNKEQNADGGWQEARDSKGSNAFATGQVLYALKAAGVSVDSAEFRRGVDFLLGTQKDTGAWPAVNTHSHRPSEFAPTMWAVIGLAGSFRESKTGSLQVITKLDEAKDAKAGHKNILIILDASGSMKQRLGKSTRIETARKVIKDLLDRIPSNYGVGLRLYAHRANAKSKDTCTDTEIVQPVVPLDRAKIAAAVDQVQPRGDTPLVYSTLQAPEDLKGVGGGSVILITDGEESCGGDTKVAAQQLKDAGIDLKVDIVGFTLKGKKVQDQLTTLAESTGGHYFPASDGDALLRSLAIATDRYPYAVFDNAGRPVVKGEADGAPIDLKPGDYRVVVYFGGQQVKKEHVRVKAGGDAVVRLVGEAGRLSFEP